MFLNKILQPFFGFIGKNNWKSRNPQVRKRAVQEIPVSDQETLGKIAMNDSDESIRSIAANKLNDLDLLQTIIIKCNSETVKQSAQIRFFQLLCGMKHPIPDYDIREKMIHGSRNPELLEFVAANADQASLREMTIKKISRDPLLGDISLTDDNQKIRQIAAQQISKRSTLERVVKNSRRKDKRVYKIVKSKLNTLIEDEKRPLLLAKEVIDICDKLEKLHKRNLLQQEKTTFDNYVKRWSEISQFANDKITQRYNNINLKITISINGLENKHKKEHEADIILNRILTELSLAVDELLISKEKIEREASDTKSPKEIAADKENVILELGREWDSQISLLQNKEKIKHYNNQFFSILELSESTSSLEESSEADSLNKLQSITAQLESISESSGFILQKTVTTLQEKFNQQIENHHLDNELISAEKVESLKLRFASICKRLDEKLLIQQQNINQLKEQIKNDSNLIQSNIDNGFVSKSNKLLQSLLKQIDKSYYLSNYEKNNYHNELKTLQLQLGELSSWQNWAHDNERENLLIKAVDLFEQAKENNNLDSEYKDITAQVKDLRQQWKKMRSHTADDLWKKFNTACNSIYELCIPFIEQQEKERNENLRKKEALCEQLENYIISMKWPADDGIISNSEGQDINWIQVDKITKQARKEWSEIGLVDHNSHKKINHRFEHSMQIIRNELNKGWQINLQKFEDLITKTEALHPFIEDDLFESINKAKQYQQQWKTIGSVSSYQRKKIWKRFRAACDVIFNKRQESIDKKNSQNDEIIREKEAICENLEALNQQPLPKKDLEIAFSDIRYIWAEIQSQPKSSGKALNTRYKQAEKEYFNKLDQLHLEEQQEQLHRIIKKAQICTEIEVMISSETINEDEYDDLSRQLTQQWKAIRPLSSSLESDLSIRFKQALEVLQSGASAEQKQSTIQNELNLKQEFCLKFEILTAKESPAGNESARMKMQVDLLKDNMGQSRSISAFEIQQQWYKLSNYSQDKELEKRFINLTT
ncbi:MAG: DUF349 domain-containing protein [gamma proteobacterium symbiont of Taylorina sp.]|nr:DUF349 domain-containing protein [gamma proteobacterium symbiont of Taylorina sp.]